MGRREDDEAFLQSWFKKAVLRHPSWHAVTSSSPAPPRQGERKEWDWIPMRYANGHELVMGPVTHRSSCARAAQRPKTAGATTCHLRIPGMRGRLGVVAGRQNGANAAATTQGYDTPGVGMFAPEVLGPTVDGLAELARSGQALEFAIGCAGGPLP